MQVKLIAFNEAIAEALFASQQDPALFDHIEESPPTDFEVFRARCKRLEHTYSPDGTQRWLNWAVEFEGRIVGSVQATVYDFAADRSRTAELAYSIHSSLWGKGVAFESCRQMLSVLRDEYQVSQLWRTIQNENGRSIRLAERLGLKVAPATQYPYTNYAEGDVVMHGTLSSIPCIPKQDLHKSSR
jgi:[ribosomal protein S5]-alanine N-acetyltransferase